MEQIRRSKSTRRLSERRQKQDTSPKTERRIAERREGFERRQTTEQEYDLARSGLLALLHPVAIDPLRKNIWSTVPRWAPLTVFALAFMILMTNFGGIQQDISSFSPPVIDIPGATASEPNYEGGEVIVYDPSDAITQEMLQSGYRVIENLEMKELGISVLQLRIPGGMTVPDAISDLRNRFPALDVDANHEVFPTNPS